MAQMTDEELELEIRKIEFEMEKLLLEERKEIRQSEEREREKERQFELKKLRLQLHNGISSDTHQSSHSAIPKLLPCSEVKSNFSPKVQELPEQNSSKDSNSESNANITNQSENRFKERGLRCNYCRKPGHVLSDCFTLKRKQERNASQNAFISTSPEGIKSDFLPFVSEGFVSENQNTSPVPINILRDTGTPRSLLLKSALRFSDDDVTEFTLIEGIGGHTISLPLVTIVLKSSLLTGPVTVGLMSTLPMKGISLLLGNDLAGGAVTPSITLTSEPVTDDVPLDVDIFPYSAVTRAQGEVKQTSVHNDSTFDSSIENLPIKGKSLLLGNDLAGGDVMPSIMLTSKPVTDDVPLDVDIFPYSAVTRAQDSKSSTVTHHDVTDPKGSQKSQHDSFDVVKHIQPGSLNLHNNCVADTSHGSVKTMCDLSLSREQLISEQNSDPELIDLRKRALLEDEISNVSIGYYISDDILMRKWKSIEVPPSAYGAITSYTQIVVPISCRNAILTFAHCQPSGGHLGVNKTTNRILKQFFWPGIRKDVSNFCRTCQTCQVIGNTNRSIPKAPLKPFPSVGEPFDRVIVDCADHLHKSTTGFLCMLTLLTTMCAATRFPEVLPLLNIKASKISEAFSKCFTISRLPKESRPDQSIHFPSANFEKQFLALALALHEFEPYFVQILTNLSFTLITTFQRSLTKENQD